LHPTLARTIPSDDTAPDACLLTILIPCLDEAETIAVCIGKALAFLAQAQVSGEVLVADNGSSDGSQAISAAAGARVVQTTTRGYGGALAGGIAAARGQYIIMGDADDSYNLGDLGSFLAKLEGGADLVMGNRFSGGIAAGAMPVLHRYLGNPVLTWVGRLLFPSPVHDFHCGLRGFRRDSIMGLDLKTTGMEYASEMVVRASLAKLKIAEVATTLSKDGRSRRPHLRTWRDGWRHLRFLLLHSPRWTFAYPGVAMILAGLGIMPLLLAGPVRLGSHVMLGSHSLLVASIAVMLGIQLVTLGVIVRRHAERTGLLPALTGRRRLVKAVTLERLLIASGVLMVVGLAGLVWLMVLSGRFNFGVVDPEVALRGLIVSSCTLATGVQLAFSGFLLGVLDLPSGDVKSQMDSLQKAFPRD